MKNQEMTQMDALVASISEIGKPKREFEFKDRKLVEELKKSRAELMQEAFNDAFEPNQD